MVSTVSKKIDFGHAIAPCSAFEYPEHTVAFAGNFKYFQSRFVCDNFFMTAYQCKSFKLGWRSSPVQKES